MRHRNNKVTLDRKAGSRDALIRGLVTNLIERGSIITTPARAAAARRTTERLITSAKKAKTQRNAKSLQYLYSDGAKARLFDELVKKYVDRTSGYTRTTKLIARKGDGAERVKIELL
jgi:large subunit ribosomal protein L17